MSSQRALIPLRFTDTEHWKKTSGINKTSNWKQGYRVNAILLGIHTCYDRKGELELLLLPWP